MTGASVFVVLVVVSFFAVLLRARLARLAAMVWIWATARRRDDEPLIPFAKRFEILPMPRSIADLEGEGGEVSAEQKKELVERLAGRDGSVVVSSPAGYTGYSDDGCGYTGYSGGYTGGLSAESDLRSYEWRQVKCGGWAYVELSTQRVICEISCSVTGLWRVSTSGNTFISLEGAQKEVEEDLTRERRGGGRRVPIGSRRRC